jgi:two-component system phosphate regulon response regulator OmpR
MADRGPFTFSYAEKDSKDSDMTDEKKHLLVVDDDERLRDLLKKFLTDHGFLITTAPDAKSARALLEVIAFDAMVLDVMMPGETGVSLAQSLDTSEIPILMLSALGEPQHRIEGLESGVRDYLTKPFEPRELILRIENILRMQERIQQKYTPHIRFGAYVFETDKNLLRRNDDIIALTTGEEALLQALLKRSGQPVSREELAKISSGDTTSSDRSVDVQINRLRKKLDVEEGQPSHIRTVRGAGYMMFTTVGE